MQYGKLEMKMMTGDEAMSLLMSAYGNEIKKGGRGCGKTAFRTALLMGANAIKVCARIPEIIEDLEGLKMSMEGQIFYDKSSRFLYEERMEHTNETIDEAIDIVKQLLR